MPWRERCAVDIGRKCEFASLHLSQQARTFSELAECALRSWKKRRSPLGGHGVLAYDD